MTGAQPDGQGLAVKWRVGLRLIAGAVLKQLFARW
jgi:hypothetical protein